METPQRVYPKLRDWVYLVLSWLLGIMAFGGIIILNHASKYGHKYYHSPPNWGLTLLASIILFCTFVATLILYIVRHIIKPALVFTGWAVFALLLACAAGLVCVVIQIATFRDGFVGPAPIAPHNTVNGLCSCLTLGLSWVPLLILLWCLWDFRDGRSAPQEPAPPAEATPSEPEPGPGPETAMGAQVPPPPHPWTEDPDLAAEEVFDEDELPGHYEHDEDTTAGLPPWEVHEEQPHGAPWY